MTNNSIEQILENSEEVIEITLLNGVTGTTYPGAAVHQANTIGQVIAEYSKDLGIANSSKLLITNKRTGESTNNTKETIKGLGFMKDDVMEIVDDARVAGARSD